MHRLHWTWVILELAVVCAAAATSSSETGTWSRWVRVPRRPTMVVLTESGCAHRTTEIQTVVQEGKHHTGTIPSTYRFAMVEVDTLESSKTPSTAIQFILN